MVNSLKRIVKCLSVVAMFCMGPLSVRAIDQAMPGAAPVVAPAAAPASGGPSMAALYAKQDRTAFEAGINLDKLRLLYIEHSEQVKILDSWARQNQRAFRHRQTLDGKDPLLTALDIAFRPEAWGDKKVIYVESPPVRELLIPFTKSAAEADELRTTGLVSPEFLSDSALQQRVDDAGNNALQHDAVLKLLVAANTFATLGQEFAIIPPPASQRELPWQDPFHVSKRLMAQDGAASTAGPATQEVALAYTTAQKASIARSALYLNDLTKAWQANDLKAANQAIDALVNEVQAVDPEGYPSHAKAVTELWYNRTFSGTLVAIIYFAAMVLFFLVAVGIAPKGGKIARTAFSIFSVALFFHLLAMGVRWWLNGRIPIQNQFESVMGSACLGCCLGIALEFWKKNGIFGTAFSFVGFLAATTLLAAPYVFGRDLGASMGKVAGILDTYWLYIHVNIVIASYALIFATAVIGAIYLCMRQWYWINPIEPGFEGQGGDAGSGGTPRGSESPTGTLAITRTQALQITQQRALALDTLDQANMVVLQMAFWFLGVGIICGAIWADHSWGRPWGWDPKETFALVTWMVYLVIVHLRLVTKHKADVTAWLALAGCGVMLFNWIGVNFFLKGLHSYA